MSTVFLENDVEARLLEVAQMRNMSVSELTNETLRKSLDELEEVARYNQEFEDFKAGKLKTRSLSDLLAENNL